MLNFFGNGFKNTKFKMQASSIDPQQNIINKKRIEKEIKTKLYD